MSSAQRPKRVLVTGATGYVASRLIPRLLEKEHGVRATSRHPDPVGLRHRQIEIVPSDLTDASSLARALRGIEVAYYLMHSMSGRDFERKDQEGAQAFARAAEAAGIERIVYLGGLGAGSGLSKHLKSRQEVGRILAGGPVPVLELRAAVVIGSGSAAFEMLRHLTEKLPFMIAPRWLGTRIQPIGEKDLVDYLLSGAEVPLSSSRVVEVGGNDVLTYKDMILGYARRRGLRRTIVSVPVLSPRLSSYWVHLVTPIKSSIAQPLIDGLKNEVVVCDASAQEAFPDIRPGGYEHAVNDALGTQIEFLDRTTDPHVPPVPGALAGIILDRQWMDSTADARTLGRVISGIGGDPRWYPLRWAWWVRAQLDDLFGGSGLRWERPSGCLRPGARVDWWTVEDIDDDRLLLKAEMRSPGEAWLEFRVVPRELGSELRQTAFFRPKGVAGRAYWWGLYPFHAAIFRLMAYRLVRRAEGVTAGGMEGLLGWVSWELLRLRTRNA